MVTQVQLIKSKAEWFGYRDRFPSMPTSRIMLEFKGD